MWISLVKSIKKSMEYISIFYNIEYFFYSLIKKSMPILINALRLLGTVALGWWASDVYNESQTTGQLNAVTAWNATLKGAKSRWWLYLLIFGVLIVIFWLLKRFKLFKR